MHHGSFPDELQSTPGDPPPAAPTVTRRAWLVGGCALAACAAATWAWTRFGGTAAPANPTSPPRAAPAPDRSAPRGTVSWALALEDGELLEAAGDLERLCARNRDQPALVPVFARLCDVAVASTWEHADEAAAAAVRSLARLGRADLASARAAAIEARADFNAARAALARIAERAEGRR